ncbi:hypothetical protein [Amycolatopsis sp. ATCC 39116]|uniref:hypothetical protein n=1 Tax=Amycolatopsis sp. (strain ATCC 39116 / 75iv2) TaxID=385957 RepID=UPI000262558C|nr:hypothetical protein [Amycolatopsis sp. ATCC 39116]
MFKQTDPEAPVRVFASPSRRFRPIHSTDVADAIVNGRTVPNQQIELDPAAMAGSPATVVDLLISPAPRSSPDAVAKAFELSLTRTEITWPGTHTLHS